MSVKRSGLSSKKRFDELGYKNDLKYERTQVDKAFSILEDRVSPSKLISASRFLGVKSPWTVGVPCEESTHELYDLLGLSPDDLSDWGLLTYVLWALDVCGYAYAVDKEESKIAMNILKRSMTEDCAYQEYVSILYAEVFKKEKYGSPAEVEEILRAHIIKAVSPFQAQTFFFAIDHPNAPLTSGEKEAIAIVEAEIKNSRLIESL